MTFKVDGGRKLGGRGEGEWTRGAKCRESREGRTEIRGGWLRASLQHPKVLGRGQERKRPQSAMRVTLAETPSIEGNKS
jgi:hypothetical protein